MQNPQRVLLKGYKNVLFIKYHQNLLILEVIKHKKGVKQGIHEIDIG